jgi:Fur family zinc uptake transcriptional regulator
MPDRTISASSRTRDGRPLRKRAQPFPAAELDRSLLDLLALSDVPLSAYALLERLRAQGRHTVAMSVYRALDRLCGDKLVEKVGMLAAFRLKDLPGAVLSICTACGRTRAVALPDIHDALRRGIERTGFTTHVIALEAAGICADCSGRAPDPGH